MSSLGALVAGSRSGAPVHVRPNAERTMENAGRAGVASNREADQALEKANMERFETMDCSGGMPAALHDTLHQPQPVHQNADAGE